MESQSAGSKFSGLRFSQSSLIFSDNDSVILDIADDHLSLCHPETLEILFGGLDKRVLIFFLLLEKQCLVIILNSLLSIPCTSGLEIGFNTTSLDFTFGEGVNEFG